MPHPFPPSLQRALLRGRFMGALATVEDTGLPIDLPFYHALREHRLDLRQALIATLDHFGFYDGDRLCGNRVQAHLDQLGLPWPRTPAGRYSLDRDDFKEMLPAAPHLRDFYDLRTTLACLKDVALAVGPDGRARTSLHPFGSITARCQPSTARFLFGWPRVFRRLIQAPPGRALAYVDVGQEEFAIAAVLSGDTAMQDAYTSGDCYLAFAKQAGAAPPEATKKTHGEVRDLYKTVVLAVQYLMTEHGLGRKLGMHPLAALRLIERHRTVYRRYWEWSDTVLSFARMYGYLDSPLGWRLNVTPDTSDRTIRNFPMQSGGADLLRLALVYALADGVTVCAPIHDALLVEAEAGAIDDAVARTRAAWQRAGRELLHGFELRVDAKIYTHPARFVDDKGDSLLLQTVQRVLRAKTGVLHGT